MWSAASAAGRFRLVPASAASSATRARRLNASLPPAAASANPSRRTAANHAVASRPGAPTSAKRTAIGAMSESVSLTSNTMTLGRGCTPSPLRGSGGPALPLGHAERRRPAQQRLVVLEQRPGSLREGAEDVKQDGVVRQGRQEGHNPYLLPGLAAASGFCRLADSPRPGQEGPTGPALAPAGRAQLGFLPVRSWYPISPSATACRTVRVYLKTASVSIPAAARRPAAVIRAAVRRASTCPGPAGRVPG